MVESFHTVAVRKTCVIILNTVIVMKHKQKVAAITISMSLHGVLPKDLSCAKVTMVLVLFVTGEYAETI